MSPTIEGKRTDSSRDRITVGPRTVLVDTHLFFFYLKGGRLSSQAEIVIDKAKQGILDLKTSSEIYDDAISAIRGANLNLGPAPSFVSDMKSIPHVALPMSAEIAEDAMAMYMQYGGRRSLSYFDSFHVATAKRYSLEFITSDSYLIKRATDLGIIAEDLSKSPKI